MLYVFLISIFLNVVVCALDDTSENHLEFFHPTSESRLACYEDISSYKDKIKHSKKRKTEVYKFIIKDPLNMRFDWTKKVFFHVCPACKKEHKGSISSDKAYSFLIIENIMRCKKGRDYLNKLFDKRITLEDEYRAQCLLCDQITRWNHIMKHIQFDSDELKQPNPDALHNVSIEQYFLCWRIKGEKFEFLKNENSDHPFFQDSNNTRSFFGLNNVASSCFGTTICKECPLCNTIIQGTTLSPFRHHMVKKHFSYGIIPE